MTEKNGRSEAARNLRKKKAKAGTPEGFAAGLGGQKIRSGGKGRGMGIGEGSGPIGRNR